MTFITKPPTGVEPLIAPGFNPGIRDDYEVQANPKGVEHPQIKQILSLVTAACGGEESLFKNETLHYVQGDGHKHVIGSEVKDLS